MADKIGYIFYIEGEFCEDLQGLPDPASEDWEYFETDDLHPTHESTITIWVPNYRDHCESALKEAVERAVCVVEWMRDCKGWEGFDARLWHGNPGAETRPVEAFKWEIV